MDFLKDLSLDKVRNLAEDAFNQAKPKTEVEARVYEVLSHKNWGSSSTLMSDIARDTFDYDKFAVISQLVWENLDAQRPAAWRVIFKGLTLLEYLIKNGSERCVDDARNHGSILRGLQKFNYYEGTVDRGQGVREKSKQVIEMLADDERVREERMKARKLREKFGGNSNAASNTMGGVGGGGGYGKEDSWETGGGGGGSGYGMGGIGSESARSTGGRYGNSSRSNDQPEGYSGRYGNEPTTTTTTTTRAATEPTPTFAAIPPTTTKQPKKSKKKKKAESEDDFAPSAAATTVDLFAFDDPVPTSATTNAHASNNDDTDDFDAFQSASGSVAAAPTHDPFAAAPVLPQQPSQFDAFHGGAALSMQPQRQQPPTHQFDAFGNSTVPMGLNPMGGGGTTFNTGNMMGFPGAMNNNSGFMSGNMQQQQQQHQPMGGPMMMMGGSRTNVSTTTHQPQQSQDDDDFGDFAGASGATAKKNSAAAPISSSTTSSSDPLGRLISLDGLSKNSAKKEDKLNQPVIYGAAAAAYMQERDMIQEQVQQAKKGSGMSFEGIDGIHHSKPSGMMGPMMTAASMSLGMNPAVMSSGVGAGGADSISSMMDPSVLSPPKPKIPQPDPNQHMGGGPMMMMANPQMMGNPQMVGGMMGGGMPNSQVVGGGVGMMMNPGMQPQAAWGGMPVGGVAMNASMMNSQGMGGFGGMMPGQVMGGAGMPGQMMMGTGMQGLGATPGMGMSVTAPMGGVGMSGNAMGMGMQQQGGAMGMGMQGTPMGMSMPGNQTGGQMSGQMGGQMSGWR